MKWKFYFSFFWLGRNQAFHKAKSEAHYTRFFYKTVRNNEPLELVGGSNQGIRKVSVRKKDNTTDNETLILKCILNHPPGPPPCQRRWEENSPRLFFRDSW